MLQAALADTGHLTPASDHGTHAAGAVLQLGAYADAQPMHKLPAFQLPSVHLEPNHGAGAPRTARSRAYLHLVDADDPGLVVIAGSTDFLIVDLDDASAPPEAQTGTSAAVYAPLFPDGVPRRGLLDDTASARWALLVEDVFIDPAFRGQWLAAWLVATIAQRVTDQTGPGFIAICPHTPDVLHTNRDDDAEDLSQRTRDYWQDHLRMTATPDGFLIVSTTSAAFADARDELKVVNDVFIPIGREQLLLRRRNNDRKLWPAKGTPPSAGHTDHTAGGTSQSDSATQDFGVRHYTDLNHIINSVHNRNDMTYASVTAVISFVGPNPTHRQQGNVFQRAADYLSEHPEIVVSSTHWRDFTDDRGTAMYALDIEVIPPAWRDALLR